jgi:hypothetical protein
LGWEIFLAVKSSFFKNVQYGPIIWGSVAGSFEYGNDLLLFVNVREFVD